MVFPSIPVYLDPPNNWNNQIHQHPFGISGSGETHQLPPGLASPRPESSGMAACSVRPGSMADRARQGKLPQPEHGLKCPRCDSSNTKFCYFNNYSLSQPRHFCKTCRRYWTRGGTLRTVPVGGGCRRNKRGKSSASSAKSSSAAASSADHRQAAGTSSSSSTATGGGSGLGAIASHMAGNPTHSPLMPSLHALADYNASNLGLSFAGIQPINLVDFQLGSSSSIELEQWRLKQTQQFPFLGGLVDSPPQPPSVQSAGVSALFPFDGDSSTEGLVGQVLPKVSGSSLIRQLSLVKMEDHNSHGLNLQRQYLGLYGNDQFWGSNGGAGSTSSGGWSGNLSNFNSSSSGNIM